ncbi:unnamed protein product [Moneuplotes crassus]|uniref:Uncharacterized protein n=1 Tax=Euplotes crassus TaxID=5936 RepID=A0AAD1UNI5_EUPCR|nr:unnamed protein product [Moneuplotes crassus]
MVNNKSTRKLLQRRAISINGFRARQKRSKLAYFTTSDRVDEETQGSSFDKVITDYESDEKLLEDSSEISSTIDAEKFIPTAIKTIVIANKANRSIHIENSEKKPKSRSSKRRIRRLRSSYNFRSNINKLKNQKTLQGFLPRFQGSNNVSVQVSESSMQSYTSSKMMTAVYDEFPTNSNIINFHKAVMSKMHNYMNLSKVDFQDSSKYHNQKSGQSSIKHPSITCKLKMSAANKIRCAKSRCPKRFRIPLKGAQKCLFRTPQKRNLNVKTKNGQKLNTSCKNTDVSNSTVNIRVPKKVSSQCLGSYVAP